MSSSSSLPTEPLLNIKPNLLEQIKAFSSKLYSHPNESELFVYFSIMRRCAEKSYRLNIKQFDRDLHNKGQSKYPHAMEEIFEGVCEVNEMLETVPCIGNKFPSILDENVEERRLEFLQELRTCAEFKTGADNKFKLVSHDEVLTRNNHLVQKYDQMLEQPGSITRFPTLYNNLHNSSNADHSQTVDQLVKKLNIEEPVKEVTKDLQSLGPNMVSLVYNLSTAFCKEQILDCIKKSTHGKPLEQASMLNLSTCLGGPCTTKVWEYMMEKSRE